MDFYTNNYTSHNTIDLCVDCKEIPMIKCDMCNNGNNLMEDSVCFQCGREGEYLKERNKIANEIEKMLSKEFAPRQIQALWKRINLLVDIEIKMESCCNE